MLTETVNNLLSVEEYNTKGLQERLSYICEKMGLRSNYLVGTLRLDKEDKNYFLIEDLVNPYTGLVVRGKLLKDAQITKYAICRKDTLSERYTRKNQKVLFRFHTNSPNTKSIKNGELLIVKIGTLIPIDDGYDVMQEMGISIDDLNVSMLLKADSNNYSIVPFSELYQSVVSKKLQEHARELDKQRGEVGVERQSVVKFREDVLLLEGEVHRKAAQLKVLGFDVFNEDVNKVSEKVKVLEKLQAESELLAKIQQQIVARGLQYNSDTLRQFYCALKTNQFIILSGPSGTGKTSLISSFAEVTSVKAKIIPVQPSWTDKQDLLGFYNPIRKQYAPSLFLDALIEASKDEETLHLICLDELNLAQIEYYLADILSIREQKNPLLALYSHYEYEQNMEEIKWFIQKCYPQIASANLEEWAKDSLNISTIDQFAYAQRFNNLRRYPWSLAIPKNVRIIGTMNIDGTVRPLSPKVVDRSFVIHLDKQTERVNAAKEKGVFNLLSSHFEIATDIKPFDKSRKDIERVLGTVLAQLKASYNNRVEAHIDLYASIVNHYGLDSKKLADEIIAMKILPRINFLLDNETNPHEQFVMHLRQLVGDNAVSYKKAVEMKNQANKTRIFSYWS